MTIGIALLLLLPVLRVVLMLIVFLRKRDYRFSAIADDYGCNSEVVCYPAIN